MKKKSEWETIIKKPTWATITKDPESESITYSSTPLPMVVPVTTDTSSDLTLTPSPGGTWEWMRTTAPTPTTTTWATSLSINPIEMGELPDIEALAASGGFDTEKGRADFVRSFESYLNGMYFTTSSRLMERIWMTYPGSTPGTTPTIIYRPDLTTSSESWEIEYGGTTLPIKSGSITYDPESGATSFSGTTSVYRNDGTYAGECMVEIPRVFTTVTESAGSTTLVATATPISSST